MTNKMTMMASQIKRRVRRVMGKGLLLIGHIGLIGHFGLIGLFGQLLFIFLFDHGSLYVDILL